MIVINSGIKPDSSEVMRFINLIIKAQASSQNKVLAFN